ncbi:MAG: SprT family zinc-dependent metalloprotease [Pseudomonadota bacterium]
MKTDKLSPKILTLASGTVPLEVTRHPTARRITLRLTTEGDAVRLVLPRATPLREGLDFAESQKDWLQARLQALPPRIPFRDGQVIPLLGVEHLIVHEPAGRRGVWQEGRQIIVSGKVEHLSRRLTDYLKTLARRTIVPRANEKAERLQKKPGRITLRDSRSRWGSCSANGNLNFSWRLILAPEHVLDYVVAHEVAHLVEHNHGPRFWVLAAQLTDDLEGAKKWLKRRGHCLHRYG